MDSMEIDAMNERAKEIEDRSVKDIAWFNMNWAAKRIPDYVAQVRQKQRLTDKAMPRWVRHDLEKSLESIQEILDEDAKR